MAEENVPRKTEEAPTKEAVGDSNGREAKDEKDQALIKLALRKSPFFACLDEEQVERFIEVAKLKSYSGGKTIILEGCVDDFEVGQDDASSMDPPDTRSQGALEDDDLEELADSDEYFEKKQTTKSQDEEILLEVVDDGGDFVIVHSPSLIPEENQGQNYENERSNPESIKDQNSKKPLSASPEELQASKEKSQVKRENTEQSEVKRENIEELEEDDEGSLPSKNVQESKTRRRRNMKNEDPTSKHYLEPPPPKSGVPSYLYIVRKGQADVMYNKNVSPVSLGTGTVFGEGGFLFGRRHSASVLASSDVECYVVDANTFRNYVLPSEKMKSLYNAYATHLDESNKPYMTMQDFVQSCLGEGQTRKNAAEDDQKKPAVGDPLTSLRIANTFNILRNDEVGGLFSRRITLPDFCMFHLLMARPDPEVDITFLLIDEHKRGLLYKEDIANFLKSSFEELNFDLNSEFFRRHFGKDDNNQRCIRSSQFSQFLVDLRREIGQQAFLQELERHGTAEGFLAPDNFVRVLQSAAGQRLPEGIAERLERVYCHKPNEAKEAEASTMRQAEAGKEPNAGVSSMEARYFAYCDFLAFQEVLGQLPGICSLIDRACEIKKAPISADDFKVANRVLGMGGRLSRRQVDIVFDLFDLDRDGFISHHDTLDVAGIETAQRVDAVPGREGSLIFAPPPKFRHECEEKATVSLGVLLEYVSLAAVTNAIGVVALYPLDLVKTRLMNERIGTGGQRMYRHSFHCLKLTLQREGLLGLYRGLLPQLLAVIPEKAIKLAVNDLVQSSLLDHENGSDWSPLNLFVEMFAGACAGACQLPVTNSSEIVKIRLQLQGETTRILQAKGFDNPVPQSFSTMVKTIGYSGLYTGARACLLRDIPFSALYFPTYTYCKDYFTRLDGSSGSISATHLFLAGTLAGVPASFLTTPADVIKTRLQAIPRPGETNYEGIQDCFKKIYEREGLSAFFRGSAVRVARISPQFGLALFAYESISQLLSYSSSSPATNPPLSPMGYFEASPTRHMSSKTKGYDHLFKDLGRPDKDKK